MELWRIIAVAVGGGAVAFAAIWLLVVFVIARLSGWAALARVHPAPAAAPGLDGERFSRAGAVFRQAARYRRCLDLTFDADGLRLRQAWLFRPFHPPLFLPWSAISALACDRNPAMKSTTIAVARCSGAPVAITLFGAAAESLARRVGGGLETG